MRIVISIKDSADVLRISDYIGELPHAADWKDVVQNVMIDYKGPIGTRTYTEKPM